MILLLHYYIGTPLCVFDFPHYEGHGILALVGLFAMAATDVDDNQARQDVAGADVHRGDRFIKWSEESYDFFLPRAIAMGFGGSF